MSWNLKFVGAARDVHAAVKEYDAHLIPEEHTQMQAAKEAICKALEATDTTQGVIVEAFGSAAASSSYNKKYCTFSAKVETCVIAPPATQEGTQPPTGGPGDPHP